MSDLKQQCVSQIKLMEELIVIQCREDHSLSIIQIKENSALQLIYKITISEEQNGEPFSDISYSDLVVIRHAKNAYMVLLQGETSKTGTFTEVFEVLLTQKTYKIIQTSLPFREDNKMYFQPAQKD